MSIVSRLLGKLRREGMAGTQVVYPWQLPSIMRKHIFTGAMGMMYFSLFSGIYLITFGNALGMDYWQWGLLSAASSFVLVLQLFSAYVVHRTGARKPIWFSAALGSRILRAAAAALALWLSTMLPGAARWAFLGLLVASNSLSAVATPPWQAWQVDIIPERTHGSFIGRRDAWIALSNMCVVVPISFGLDRTPENLKIPAIMGIFAFALVLGVLDLFIHRTIPEPPMKLPPERHIWKEVMGPLRDRRFRPWLIFNGFWTFGMSLGGSLAMIYFVEDLGIKQNFFGGSLVLIMLPLAGTVLTGSLFGAMVDRLGVKRVFRWGYLVWAFLPLFWVPATPKTALWWLAGGSLCGLAANASTYAANKLLIRLPHPGEVAMYGAVSSCVESIGGGLGALTAGLVLQSLKGLSWQVAGFTFVGFHALFLVSFLLRGASTLLISRIHEPAPHGAVAPE